MSARALAPTQKAATLTPGSVASGVLQRQCACGQHTIAGGECEECRKNRLTVQHRAMSRAELSAVSPMVPHGLPLSTQPRDRTSRARAPRFAHDYGRIPITGDGTAKRPVSPNYDTGSPVDPISYGLTAMARLLRERDQGARLETETRQAMETRLGSNLRDVRVHSGSAAQAAAKLVGARAFTIGKDIYLDRPLGAHGDADRRVLAHELAHTVQQQPWAGTPIVMSSPGSDQEREAERVVRSPVNGPLHGVPAAAAQPATLMPLAAAAWALIAGELACLFGFYFYALTQLRHKGDKWLHCWTSCKIATYCGGLVPLVGPAIAAVIGALKELADIVIGEAELRDMKNNFSGIECSFHLLTSCADCCEAKLARGALASTSGEAAPEGMVVASTAGTTPESGDDLTGAAATDLARSQTPEALAEA